MRLRNKVLIPVGVIAAAAALVRVSSRVRSRNNSATEGQSNDKPLRLNSSTGESDRREDQATPAVRRMIPWYLLVGSTGLSVLAIYAQFSHQTHAAAMAILVAFAFSSFLLRRPRAGASPIILISSILFAIQFLAVLGITLNVVLSGPDPAILLQMIAFSICALGLLLFVAVTWMRGWPFAEPLALGLFAVSLGALCLPVLHLISGPPVNSNADDAGTLYATGQANQGLSLNVQFGIFDSPYTTESLQINNRGGYRINWALVLTAGARFRTITYVSPHIDRENLITFYPLTLNLVSAQIFSGSIDRGSSERLTGNSYGRFISNSGAQSSVVLPLYLQGDPDQAMLFGGNRILDALSGYPTYHSDFSVVVSSGHLPPFDSLSQVVPNMTTLPSDPTELRWASNSSIHASYETINQGVFAAKNDVLFVFAVLLGVAGAALIGSLQATVHILSSRKLPLDFGYV